MANKTIKARVFGTVQGVCFREFTRRQANELNLGGWVRNLPDGSVESHVSGEEGAVDTMIAWLHSGSPYATVERVEVTELEPEPTTVPFKITY